MAKRECKIIIRDEVTCRITGLLPEHLNMLYDEFSVFATNYIFNVRYKIGQWDGKIRFVDKEGLTYVYLLEQILPTIIRLQYRPVIEDRRVPAPAPPKPTDDMFNFVIHPETEEPLILRDYQINAISAVVDAGGYGIILASTSAGKTLICAALCATYQKLGYKTVTIVPNTDLLSQTRDDYVMCKLDVGEYSGDVKDIKHDHIISTWQALKNAPVMMSEFDVVIVDECLDGDTPITMADGTTKPIRSVVAGDLVLSYDATTSTFEPDCVVKTHTNLTKSSNSAMYELELDDGSAIQVTGNHNILTSVGYVRADELTSEHDIISLAHELQ